ETQSFAVLYDAYVNKIYDYIFYRTGHKELSEDLTSAAFIKAVQKIKSFDSGKGSFSAWIYRIARNTLFDHYRTRKESENIENAFDLKSKDNIEKEFEAQERLKEVLDYLKNLSAEQRDIVI